MDVRRRRGPGLLLVMVLLVSCDDRDSTRGGPSPDRPELTDASGQVDDAGEVLQVTEEDRVRRLSLDEFSELPGEVRAQFEELGCLVPQSWADPEPHNVVRGAFAAAGQEDWAALCSAGGEHRIVVVWGGPSRCPSPLAEAEHERVLQSIPVDRGGFSRAIGSVVPEMIRRYHEAFGGPEPPEPLTHEGIEDHFVGKASVVRYCEAGEWLKLTGMD